MKYISIDLETTGLEKDRCQILSFGAIIEDTENKLPLSEIPKFHAAILHSELTGSPFALNMNKKIIEAIVQYQTAKDQDEKNDLVQMTGMHFYHEDQVVEAFYRWLYGNGMVEIDPDFLNQMVTRDENGKIYPMITSKTKPVTINVAGKNFASFDKHFIERLPRWKQLIRIRQRIIDPAVIFTDWKTDDALPSLDKCKERAKIQGEVTHDALEDAWDVIELLRTQY
jgi:DNA polymerase III epsilon subunit-like protein